LIKAVKDIVGGYNNAEHRMLKKPPPPPNEMIKEDV